jgi:hypothetical protein
MSEPRDLQPREDRQAKPPRLMPLASGRRISLATLAWMMPTAAMLAAILVFGVDSYEQRGIPAPAVVQRGSDLNPEATGSVNPSASGPRSERAPAATPRGGPALSRPSAQPDFGSSEADLAAAPALAPSPPGVTGRAAPQPDNAGPSLQRAAPSPLPLRAERPASASLTLSSEALATHLARGDQKLRAGELATARLYFERVVQAGDARGAIGMARSYDPAVLADLPLIGPQGDADLARKWYQRATSLQAGTR